MDAQPVTEKNASPLPFDWNEIYVLNPDHHLYLDDDRALIVNRKEPRERRYWYVDTRQAFVGAFLDGTKTFKDLIPLIAYVADLSAEDAEKMIADFMKITVFPLVKFKDLPAGARLRKNKPADFVKGGNKQVTNRIRTSFPLSLMWMPTLECATRCIYCYMHKRKVPREAMLSDERNRRLIREIIDLDVPWLTVGGGDLFMHEHVFDYLELLTAADIFPEPLSTKVPLTREQIRRLVEIGVKAIQYSIDGPNAEVCDFLMRTPGWFDRSVETIRNLAAAGIKVTTHTILTSYNADLAAETVRFMYSLGARTIRVDNYSRSTYHHSESFWTPRAAAEKLEGELGELRGSFPDAEINYKTDTDYLETSEEAKKKSWPPKSICTAYTMGMTILPDGECIACEQVLQDEYNSMGSVRDKTIREVWDSPRARELAHPPRELFKGTVCFDCEDFDPCHYQKGYCFRLAYTAYGSIYAPPPNCPRAPRGLKISGCV